VRRADAWKADGRKDWWEPSDAARVKTPASLNPGPVGDWLDAIGKDREPECSGRNGAWAVEMVMAVYQAALSGRRVTFPLAQRKHPLAGK
jgi:predicted dehydrogenase